MSGILTDEQRDLLLIRLDERTTQCAVDITSLRDHECTNELRIDNLEINVERNTTNIKWLTKIGTSVASLISAALGISFGLTK